MQSVLVAFFAAFFEIAGCFAFWAWWRLNQNILVLVPGIVCLGVFAYLLTFIESDYAGRSFAGYGGLYIVASLLWMWLVEKQIPDIFDLIGAGFCILGALIIFYGHKFF